MRLVLMIGAALTLTACDRAEPSSVQRVELGEARPSQPQVMEQSPDTAEAYWQVDDNGQAIRFGDDDAAPLLTLACRLSDEPPALAIIRHAPARPGLSALFPVIGNGMRSRFMVDAQLKEGEWRWEAALPADDPQLDVFTGTRDITATLPGGGMLEIHGSRLPGEFVSWCRSGGQAAEVQPQTEAQAEEPLS